MESRTCSTDALVRREIQDSAREPPVVVAGNVSFAISPPLAVLMMAIHTLLARVSNNVNQIARHANAGDEFPQDAKAALAYVREVAMRIDRTIEGLV